MATLASLVVRLTADSTGLQRGVQKAQRSVSRAGKSMKRTGSMMTKGLTLPLVGAGLAAGNMAMDFESSMSKITGLVGVSQEQVSEWGDQVLELGPKLGKSPRELADALFTVSSAGFRGAEAIDVLTSAAKASAAGLGETRTIAEAVTGAINAYTPAVLGAEEATDTLVATARAGNFETSELAGSLGQVTQFAEPAGASLSDIGGGIALLTRITNDANEASTQMASLFRSFAAPTKQTQKALDDLGMSTDQVRKMMSERGLVGTLRTLDEALGGNRDKLREIVPDSTAFAAASSILNANAETLESTFGQVAEAAGMTDEAFKEAEKTARHKFNKAMAGAQGTLIKLGNVILPIVVPMLEDLTDLIEKAAGWFDNLSGPMKTAIVIFGGLVAAAGPVIFVAGAMATAIGAITAPILIAIGVIGALIAIGVLLVKHWDTVTGALSAMWDTLTAAFGAGVKFIKAVPGKIVSFFLGLPEKLLALGKAAIEAYIDFWLKLPHRIGFLIGRVLKLVIEWGPKVVGFLFDFGKRAVLGYIDWWVKLPGRIFGILETVVAKIIEVAPEIAAKALQAGEDLVASFMDVVKGLPGMVLDVIKAIPGKILSGVGGLASAAKEAAGGLWSGFKEGLGISSPSFIEEAMDRIVGNVSEGVRSLSDDVRSLGTIPAGLQKDRFEPRLEASMPPGLRMQGQGGAKQEKHFHLHVNGEGPTGPTLTGFRMLQALEER